MKNVRNKIRGNSISDITDKLDADTGTGVRMLLRKYIQNNMRDMLDVLLTDSYIKIKSLEIKN